MGEGEVTGFTRFVKKYDEYKYLAEFFGNELSPGAIVKDKEGNTLNTIHMMATIGVGLFGTPGVNADYFGWAGDVMTGAKNIYDYKRRMDVSREEAAKEIIGVNTSISSCSLDDLYSDVDSYNIMKRYKGSGGNTPGSYLISIFEDYYTRGNRNRFKDFYDSLGGKSGFAEYVENTLSEYILKKVLGGNAGRYEIKAAGNRFVEIIEEKAR
ncbi:hypothetical protein [Peptoclostridium litorale]|uniref:hypothetical protein n=1 Tax=Peptoclostridium litorale TaxID=1557 RepID=UPI000570E9AE|nr:hypothetical protein [Peptoclostridium litorale]